MKLERLSGITQRPSRESPESAVLRVRRVDALEGVEADRERSLQQEIAEIEPEAIAVFDGSEQILQDARDLAAQVAALGAAADGLIKPVALPVAIKGIDDSA